MHHLPVARLARPCARGRGERRRGGNVSRMSGAPEVHGDVAPGYEAVAEALAKLFADGAESGASAAAIHDGRLVVDVWGGSVGRDSLVHVYSVTKPFAAACALWLVDRGVL